MLSSAPSQIQKQTVQFLGSDSLSWLTQTDPATYGRLTSIHRPPSGRWLKITQLGIDLLGIFVAYSVVLELRVAGHVHFDQVFSGLVMTFAGINVLCLYFLDLYRLEPQKDVWKKPLQAAGGVLLAGCVIVLYSYLTGHIEYRGVHGRLIGAQLFLALWAASTRFFILNWLKRVSGRSRWLVLGASDYLTAFVEQVHESGLSGYFGLLAPEGTVANIEIASRGKYGADSDVTCRRVGTWRDLADLGKQQWSGIIVCAGSTLPEALVEILMRMRLGGVRVVDLADFYEDTWTKVPVFYLQKSWFAMAQGFQLLHNPIGLRVKRIADIFCAGALMVLTAPLMLLVAVAIRLDSPGPVIFAQTRVGARGRLFTLYKLRSMRLDAEPNGAQWASQNDARVTRVGAFLRATRIDELPQCFNVLRGDMSFIGARPERPEFTSMLEREIPYYNLRHILRPGVTGWAQVMYPYGASLEDAREKLQYELYYIKNYSLLLDATIVLKTMRVVLFGQGR